ncbi:hypothetical protein NBRC116583_08630 [Arenicella sp. 4NH20-0111]|uniref:hypothetical protein n=1 Tax=Arenicella sp. 4NH20-0111 TaxID=3127648 RepID=UPI003103929C
MTDKVKESSLSKEEPIISNEKLEALIDKPLKFLIYETLLKLRDTFGDRRAMIRVIISYILMTVLLFFITDKYFKDQLRDWIFPPDKTAEHLNRFLGEEYVGSNDDTVSKMSKKLSDNLISKLSADPKTSESLFESLSKQDKDSKPLNAFNSSIVQSSRTIFEDPNNKELLGASPSYREGIWEIIEENVNDKISSSGTITKFLGLEVNSPYQDFGFVNEILSADDLPSTQKRDSILSAFKELLDKKPKIFELALSALQMPSAKEFAYDYEHDSDGKKNGRTWTGASGCGTPIDHSKRQAEIKLYSQKPGWLFCTGKSKLPYSVVSVLIRDPSTQKTIELKDIPIIGIYEVNSDTKDGDTITLTDTIVEEARLQGVMLSKLRPTSVSVKVTGFFTGG